MIIEGLMTSTALDGTAHVAPMGPVVDASLKDWLLRPFQTSTTFANLYRTGTGVFHVVDDCLPIVQAALGLPIDLQFERLDDGAWVIPSACHWYRLELHEWDISQPRAEVKATVAQSAVIRPFWGWNRAKHAVLEATILATRLHLTGVGSVLSELDRMALIVEKTAGDRELQAWQLVSDYIRQWKS